MKICLSDCLIACLLVLSYSCAQDSGTKSGGLPQTKEIEMLIEGEAETLTATLFQAPEDFPLAFHTYVPEGFTTDRQHSGEADILVFNNGKAQLKLLVFSQLVNQNMADGLVKSMIQSQGKLNIEQTNGRTLYQLQGDADKAVNAEVGQRAGRCYIWWQEFPWEDGDDFLPGAKLIVDNLEWGSQK